MDELTRMCFGCGQNNPSGLHLKMEKAKDGSWQSVFVAEEIHSGWPGVVHGGILSTLLDEAMSYVPYGRGVMAVTARLRVDFKEAARVGERLTVRAWAVKENRRVIEVEASIEGQDGRKVATATGRLLVLSEEQKRRLGLPERVGKGG